jgi:transketolase
MTAINLEKPEQKALRNQYGETLVALGAENPDIVVLDADLACSTQTQKFAEQYPERFFNQGISEQDLINTAAGLSTTGKIPFCSTFAIFAAGKGWDQIRNTVCYSGLNVKICPTHSGLSLGEDGASSGHDGYCSFRCCGNGSGDSLGRCLLWTGLCASGAS